MFERAGTTPAFSTSTWQDFNCIWCIRCSRACAALEGLFAEQAPDGDYSDVTVVGDVSDTRGRARSLALTTSQPPLASRMVFALVRVYAFPCDSCCGGC